MALIILIRLYYKHLYIHVFILSSETESPRILDQLFRRHLLSHVGTHPFKVKYNLKIK